MRPERASSESPIPAPADAIGFSFDDLDPDGDPRRDLDAFVNARWRARHALPPDRSCWDAFAMLAERSLAIRADIARRADRGRSDAERVVADLWTSGMDVDAIERRGIDPLRAELERIATLEDSAAVAGYIADRHARGWPVAFNVSAEPDFDDPAMTIACISQGGLGLPDRASYLDDSDDAGALRSAYRSYIADALALAGTEASEAQRWSDIVLAFETQLARASTPRRDLARDIALGYHAVTLDEAEALTPGFSWRAFFAAQDLQAPARFSLAMPAFHAELAAMLSGEPVRHWRAYLTFHAVDDALPLLAETHACRHDRFHLGVVRGQHEAAPRWKRVLGIIDAVAGEAMGELHVERDLAGETKPAVEAMFEHLRNALGARIARIEWLSPEGRSAALAKLAAMRAKIGHQERWPDWSLLPTSPDTWFENLAAARIVAHRRMIARIGKPTDCGHWRILAQTVNAGYDPQQNEVVFPAAILKPPFFDPDGDAALNYGAIGAVIAHEMTHALDDQGSRFDAEGRFRDQWSALDRENFRRSALRLSTQCEALRATGEAVDGPLTLGENIADFGGLSIAFDALMDVLDHHDDEPHIRGHTPQRRFFFAWAALWRQRLSPAEARFRRAFDRHAPARVRANLAPSNMAAYAEAFGCAPGDPMWREPEARVRIW